tara:strand:- start:209 stop:523 length:315 start_codon:yes stop_codon:yes gene_type:complete
MFDYYTHVNSLTEDKVVAEIEKLTKRLLKTRPDSPIYAQVSNYLDMAQSAYQDIMYSHRIKNESSVMDIGEIESTVIEPDYTKQEIVTDIVQTYISSPRRGRSK